MTWKEFNMSMKHHAYMEGERWQRARFIVQAVLNSQGAKLKADEIMEIPRIEYYDRADARVRAARKVMDDYLNKSGRWQA